MVACILLDQESRTTILDADPTDGSLKEPLIKITGLMRALEFRSTKNAGFVDFLTPNLMSESVKWRMQFPTSFLSFCLSTNRRVLLRKRRLSPRKPKSLRGPG